MSAATGSASLLLFEPVGGRGGRGDGGRVRCCPELNGSKVHAVRGRGTHCCQLRLKVIASSARSTQRDATRRDAPIEKAITKTHWGHGQHEDGISMGSHGLCTTHKCPVRLLENSRQLFAWALSINTTKIKNVKLKNCKSYPFTWAAEGVDKF